MLIFELHCGAEYDASRGAQLGDIDDFRVRQSVLDVVDAPFDEALLLACGVIFGILGQIAVSARFGDRLDDVRSSLALQLLQLLPQPLGAAKSHGSALHVGSTL